MRSANLLLDPWIRTAFALRCDVRTRFFSSSPHSSFLHPPNLPPGRSCARARSDALMRGREVCRAGPRPSMESTWWRRESAPNKLAVAPIVRGAAPLGRCREEAEGEGVPDSPGARRHARASWARQRSISGISPVGVGRGRRRPRARGCHRTDRRSASTRHPSGFRHLAGTRSCVYPPGLRAQHGACQWHWDPADRRFGQRRSCPCCAFRGGLGTNYAS